jgi:hypothetical protein
MGGQFTETGKKARVGTMALAWRLRWASYDAIPRVAYRRAPLALQHNRVEHLYYA